MPRRDPTPALTRLVAEHFLYEGGPGQMAIDARRELRTLLAVARAVDAYDRRPAGNEDEDGLRYAAMVRALQRLKGKGRP